MLENCIVQTTGSAGESLAFGIATALPALLLHGLRPRPRPRAPGGAAGRRAGRADDDSAPPRADRAGASATLTYPEGTACAEVLDGGRAGRHHRAHGGRRVPRSARSTSSPTRASSCGGRSSAGCSAGCSGSRTATWSGTGSRARSVAMEISPELLGVGYIIGPRVAGITFAGGVLSYLILIPIIRFFGDGLPTPLLSPEGTLIRDMSPDEIHRAYVLYIGAGAVATGGLISLVRSMPTIVRGLPARRSGPSSPQPPGRGRWTSRGPSRTCRSPWWWAARAAPGGADLAGAAAAREPRLGAADRGVRRSSS